MADPLDDLFALPLEEFTASRNRLGLREPKKPTVPAWVVNQLARREAALMQALVEAGEEQARALQAGAGSREAQAAERKALAELSRAARKVLDASGRQPTAAVLDRVVATLAAGVQTKDGQEALLAGRLTEEIEPVGFEALTGLTPAPAARDDLAARRREKEQRTRRRRKLQDEARELESKARAAEREADRAEAAAGKARAAADKARSRADEATSALADPG